MKNLKDPRKKCSICHDSRKCFARNGIACNILYHTYDEDGECPFCKRRIEDKPAKKTRG